jgi:hypothetical protein
MTRHQEDHALRQEVFFFTGVSAYERGELADQVIAGTGTASQENVPQQKM